MDGRVSRKKSHRKSGTGQSGDSSHRSAGEGGRSSGYSSGLSAWNKQAGPAFSLGSVQRKPAISTPGDPYEREADAVADKVTSGQSVPAISRLPAGGLGSPAQRQAKEEEKPADQAVQRQPEKEEETPMTGVQRQKKPEDEPPVQTQPKKDEEQPVQKQATKEEDKPVQKQATDEEEEKPVQAKAKPEKEKPVQRQMNENEDEQVQTKAKPEEKDVQAKAQSSGPGASGGMGAAASRAIASKGQGRPMAAGTRQTLESGLGADLGHVRVHDSPAERDAAEALNARAFTHGNDIWLGHGESDRDTRLMAHEATHIVQQNDNLNRQVVQRQNNQNNQGNGSQGQGNGNGDGAAQPAVDPKTLPEEQGKMSEDESKITFSQIDVPAFKVADHRESLYASQSPLKRNKSYDRSTPEQSTRQRDDWRQNLDKRRIRQILEQKITTDGKPVDPSQTYVFKVNIGENKFVIGTLDSLATELTTPFWGGRGRPTIKFFHVDHIVELQIANWPDNAWANTLANMELLEGGANMASGRIIKGNIINKVDDFREAAGGPYAEMSASDIKSSYDLEFRSANGRGGPEVTRRDYWAKEEIMAGDHLNVLEISDLASLGGEGKVRIFPSGAGGISKEFQWDDSTTEPQEPANSGERNWLKPFVIRQKQFVTMGNDVETTPTLGSLTIFIPENDEEWKPYAPEQIPVSRIPGAHHAGNLSKESVKRKATKLGKKGASPIRINQFDIQPEGGLFISGQIVVEGIPIIAGTEIDFVLSNGELTFSKTFDTGEFQVPRPFTVTNSSIRVFASTGEEGLGVEGQLDFEVDRLGEGNISAEASTGGGFNLAGGFNFDSELFDPARIDLRYRDNVLSADGELGIPEGKVPGIRSATIHASYTGETERFEASGTAQLDIPGVEEGEMHLSYSEQEGFTIGGSFQLTSEVPGIRSGSVEAEVRKRPQEEGYAVSAHGTAVPDIPGVSANIDVNYDDGIFTIEGSAAYDRGMLSGSILIGVTNRPVGENGEPAGGEPTDELHAYGGGEVTIQVAPWLEGTIGINLLPNGEIEVSGRVGLPDTVELFPEKSYDKNLFTIGLDIPIVGVAVAGQRIGIFATISGGLDASAGIGPGELQEMELTVTYNPDHEEDTTVTGNATFVIPAHAGLRLFVRGSLGAGIPIVSASAGLEVSGELGLEGEARAGVQVDWTPTTGLSLDAEGSIFVQPKFVFKITGFVMVEADLLFTTIELYSKRWNLASFEYGSNIRFGIVFPVHYQQGEPFDLSLSDIEFVYPDIDAESLLSGLVDRIA